jgi:integrase
MVVGKQGRRGWGRIRKLPSKRWQANYVGPDLMRHNAPVTFTAKMDAERWLSDERRLIERDDWTPPAARAVVKRAKGVAVGEYATAWLAQRPLKHRTRAHYAALLANHIATSTLGAVPLKNLTPQAVRAWYAALDPTHKTARSHAYSLLHSICATAVADGVVADNPCAIKGAMTTTRQRQPVILSVEEMAALAEAIEPQLKALVLVSAWCGLRWGEVVELRRKDVSVDASVLSVGRAATHRGGCRIDTPKSGRPRVVVVPPHIRPDIEAHLAAHVAKDGDALLFPPARGGCHLNDKVFRDTLAPALKAVGRTGLRVHDLRHFSGTQVARVGSLIETMSHLGHSTVGASLRYQHMVDGRAIEIAEALSKLAEKPAEDQRPL